MSGAHLLLGATDEFGLSFILEIVTLPLLLAFIIFKFPGPLVRDAMEEKRAAIRAALEAGDVARAEAAALVARRRSELEAARSESETILETARRSAEQLRSDGERRAAAEYERIVASAAEAVALERARVRDQVSAELGAVVVEAAREVIEAELDAGNHRRLIDEMIDSAEAAS